MADYPSGQGNRQQAANDNEISNKRLKTMDQHQLSRLVPSMMPVPLPQPNPLPNMPPNAQLPIPGSGVGLQSSNTAGLDLARVLNNQQQRSISLPHQATTATTQSPLLDGRSPPLTFAATTGAGASSSSTTTTTDHNSSQHLAVFSPINTSQHNILNFSSQQFQQNQIQSYLAQQATLLQIQQQALQQQGQGLQGPSLQSIPLLAGPASINNAAMLQYMVQQNQALMAALAAQQHDPNSRTMTTASVASASVPSAGLGQQHQQQQQLPSLQAQLAMLRNPQIGGSTQPATMTPNTMIPQSGTGNSRVATSSARDVSQAGAADDTATTGWSGNVNHPSTDAATSKEPPMSGRRPALIFMPCDHDSLSEYQCLVRKQIEIFEATQQDVESSAKGRNRPIVLGQVGIRCRHCTTLLPKNRTRGATYFPTKLSGLYQAAQSMASGHLCSHCGYIPNDLREELLVLRERKSSAGGGKKYWADGLRVLGVIEDENGLRFKL